GDEGCAEDERGAHAGGHAERDLRWRLGQKGFDSRLDSLEPGVQTVRVGELEHDGVDRACPADQRADAITALGEKREGADEPEVARVRVDSDRARPRPDEQPWMAIEHGRG